MKKYVGIVAVKGNSERIPKKNIRPFANTTLLDLKLQQLSGVTSLDEIVVSSEDSNLLDIASKYKVTLHHRDPLYSQSTISMNKVFNYLSREVTGTEIVWIPVTVPLAGTEFYQKIIEFYDQEKPPSYDCLLGANRVNKYIIYNNNPLNFQINSWPRSQDIIGTYELNFAIRIAPRKKIIEWNGLFGTNPYYYEIDNSLIIDIDCPIDFEICEYLYKKTLEK